jgi:hypothetical protein
MVKNSDIPLTRRLQAQAAKSAVCRVQQIYDDQKARLELLNLSDPIELKNREDDIPKEGRDEIDAIRGRLSDLIPTDGGLGEGAKIDQYVWGFTVTFGDGHVRNVVTKPEEINGRMVIKNLVRSSTGNCTYSIELTSIEDQLELCKENVAPMEYQFGKDIDYLNPWGGSPQNSEDKLIKEWTQRAKQSRLNATKVSKDDDFGDGTGVIIV